jgi:hypothetical protein
VVETLEELQQRICRTYGVEFVPPVPGSKVGIALRTLDQVPLHGMRVPPTETTCGWYLHAGEEWSDADDFYQPLCVDHLEKYCKLALPFLGLPPGWRFITDAHGYMDVWHESALGAD